MSAIRYPFTVDAVQRHEDGYWTATLAICGTTYECDRSQGSWRITPNGAAVGWQELPATYAAAIQTVVRRLERAERIVINCECQPSGQTCDLCRPAMLSIARAATRKVA